MNAETIRRISLARYLYQLGSQNLRSNNELHLCAAVNLLQDSVETFLLAVASNLNAQIPLRAVFHDYISKINDKLQSPLPFAHDLGALNTIRVGSKHYATRPARSECERLSLIVREFFEEVSSTVLGVSFAAVSAIDILTDGEVKTLLVEAQAALKESRHHECSINCRKALYIEIEREYDVRPFLVDQGAFGRLVSRAPLYAQSKQYIDTKVNDATEFIVLDHAEVERVLVGHNAEPATWWNISRLTPSVYRNENGHWTVKHDFATLDPKHLEQHVEYIFSATVELIMNIHTSRSGRRFPEGGNYVLSLARECVPVYVKADTESRVLGHTPPGLSTVNTAFSIDGLNGHGIYWYIFGKWDDLILFGYVRDEDVSSGPVAKGASGGVESSR